ncbi:hypothetical protein F030043B2_24270 [Bacteroides fragilis]
MFSIFTDYLEVYIIISKCFSSDSRQKYKIQSDKKREKRKKTVRNREKKRPKVKVMTIPTHLSSRFIFSDDGKDKQSDNTSNIEL